MLHLIYSLQQPWEVENIIFQLTNEEMNLLRFTQKKTPDRVVIRNQVCLISVCAWLIKPGKFSTSSLYQAKYFDLLLEYLIRTLKFLILELILAVHTNQLCAIGYTIWGKRAANREYKCEGRIFDENNSISSDSQLLFLESQSWGPAAMDGAWGTLRGGRISWWLGLLCHLSL